MVFVETKAPTRLSYSAISRPVALLHRGDACAYGDIGMSHDLTFRQASALDPSAVAGIPAYSWIIPHVRSATVRALNADDFCIKGAIIREAVGGNLQTELMNSVFPRKLCYQMLYLGQRHLGSG